MNHAQDKDRRKLSETCFYCAARPGDPCGTQRVAGQLSQTVRYYCPDLRCDQLYEKPHEALSCVFHNDNATK